MCFRAASLLRLLSDWIAQDPISRETVSDLGTLILLRPGPVHIFAQPSFHALENHASRRLTNSSSPRFDYLSQEVGPLCSSRSTQNNPFRV